MILRSPQATSILQMAKCSSPFRGGGQQGQGLSKDHVCWEGLLVREMVQAEVCYTLVSSVALGFLSHNKGQVYENVCEWLGTTIQAC